MLREGGRAVSSWFITIFVPVTQAVQCAAAIQKGMHLAGELIDLRIVPNAYIIKNGY